MTVDVTGHFIGPSKDIKIFEPGTIVNSRYCIAQLLGVGGMGVVYRVLDNLHLERKVALKIVRTEDVKKSHLDMFKAEFLTMSKLHHPNVAEVYDFELMQKSQNCFFTMEYLEGEDIYHATENKDIQSVLDLVVQACRALSYVHSRGLIHFDLKPANIIVDETGHVKVLDFGLASVRQLILGGSVRGTASYMAPEMTQPHAQMDLRADLYSLGVVVYQLLCRELPFKALSFEALARLHNIEPLRFDSRVRERVPAWLRGIIECLCAKIPADRYRTANAVIQAINTQGGNSYELETAQTRESYILSSRFVGRDLEMKELACFIAKRTGDGQTACPSAYWIGGQSGIGKSRLMRELRHYAQLSRLPFIEANCYEGAFDEFEPFAESLGYVIRLAEASGAGSLVQRYGPEIVKIYPILSQERNIRPSPSIDNPEAEKRRLWDCLVEFIIQVAETTPFILYFNDLQWASPGTTGLIHHLIRSVSLKENTGTRIPLAIFGTYRDEEVEGRPVEQMLKFDPEEKELNQLILKPLNPYHIGLLLSSMLGVEALPQPFVERVAHETGGNPFFVEELMRTLIENQTVYLDDGVWTTTTGIEDLDIPASIVAVFERRVSFLNAAQRAVLDVMAVYGRPLNPAILEFACEIPNQILHQILAHLTQRQMIRRGSGPEIHYHITHDRLREILLDGLSESNRQQLHGRIGLALETLYADCLGEYVFQLAFHFWHAQDKNKALQYCLAGGDKAWESYVNDRAIELYTIAKRLLAESDPGSSRLLDITEKLGDCYELRGDHLKSIECYRKVLVQTQDRLKRARLSRKIGNSYFQKDELDHSIRQLWEAVELQGGSRPRGSLGWTWALATSLGLHLLLRLFPWLNRRAKTPEKKARIAELCISYARLGYVYFFQNPKGLLLCALRGLLLAEKLGVSKELCNICSGVGLIYSTLAFFRSGLSFGRRALRMAEELNSIWHKANALSFMGHSYFYASQWSKALALLHPARKLYLHCGDTFELGVCDMHIFYCLIYLGRLDEALSNAQEALQILRRIGVKQMMERNLIAACAYSWGKKGETSHSLAEVEQALRLSEEVNDPLNICSNLTIMGELLLTAGKIDRAVEAFQRAILIREQKRIPQVYIVLSYPQLARALVEKLRRDREKGLPDEKRRLRLAAMIANKSLSLTRRKYPSYRVPALIAKAICQWQKGNEKAARRLFRDSHRKADQQGARLWDGEAYLEEGRCLAEKGPSKLNEAKVLYKQAFSLFETCGASLYVARTQSLIRDISPESPGTEHRQTGQ